ncbi:MAG: glutamate--cysteine ligase [Cellvibrionales bacterium]|jgi:glutamate--cysteine ligase
MERALPGKRELVSGAGYELLVGLCRGIEKEGLRVSEQTGMLAQTPHPRALGSALTHPSITTDYSEALLEFITPVSADVGLSLEQLDDIHRFTAGQLQDELVWGASMPCIVAGERSIPIAHYGASNVGTMKRVYRNGLGVRYGRMMQAIAGIHYNFSLPSGFWEAAWQSEGCRGSLQDYQTEGYLGLIRNFFDRAWLLIYLLGASPAVCASFLAGNRNHPLEAFDSSTNSLYLPHATSLRMGDLGYTSNAQSGLQVCYNQLDNYISTLSQAIVTPHGDYAEFTLTEEGERAQLNDSLLQIENEFYSPIRPKRVTASGEAPVVALRRGGIEYVEVRCIDINPFLPLGIDAETIHLIDTFLLDATLSASPLCDEQGQRRNRENLNRIVNRGRHPQLKLVSESGELPFADAANALLGQMALTAEQLDRANGGNAHQQAIAMAQERVADAETTPSARVLREMRDTQQPFWQLALNYSRQWHSEFRSRPLSPIELSEFTTASEVSLRQQADLEAATEIPFEDYLANFYEQYKTVLAGS